MGFLGMEGWCGVPGSGFLFYTLAEFIAIDGHTYMQQCIFEIVIRSSCSLHMLSDIYFSK
jgi:hypothetical protein